MTVRLTDGFIASGQTGAYPRTSTKGNTYSYIFYVYNPNYIKGIAIKSRHSSKLLRAYQNVYKWCKKRGFKPTLHSMDNKTSVDVEQFIAKQNTNVQYTAPGRHCAQADKTVQTYKSYFKSTTASLSLPPKFPVLYWCRLLP